MLNREPDKEDLEATRSALALCENIDWNVGRMLGKLDELGIADDTIVFYFGDNGPNGVRWNGGMKGRKGFTDEGGVRVPALMRWPGHIQPGVAVTQISGAIDLLPTFAEMARISIVGDKPLDGVSLKPLLFGEDPNWPDRMIFSHPGRRISVRNQQYRFDSDGQLFDMIDDPGQDKNIAEEDPETASTFTGAVKQWSSDVPQKPEVEPRPFPVGYPECPTTRLPARDGVPNGNVQRSTRSPNCSYFTNWTRLEDRITWDIEVAAEGDYEAAIWYTCPEKDIGSTIELNIADASVSGKVLEANDPPLVGEEFDRYPRTNSYVKDFKPLELGTIHLKKSRGTLAIRAIDIPGKQVMDVRRVMLKLLQS